VIVPDKLAWMCIEGPGRAKWRIKRHEGKGMLDGLSATQVEKHAARVLEFVKRLFAPSVTS